MRSATSEDASSIRNRHHHNGLSTYSPSSSSHDHISPDNLNHHEEEAEEEHRILSNNYNRDDDTSAPIIEEIDTNNDFSAATSSSHSTSSSSSIPSQSTSSSTSPSAPPSEERNDLFECNICFDPANEPVITVCGHLFCWPCLYKWLNAQNNKSQQCPVCKAGIEKDKIIPIYGRGGSSSSKSNHKSADINSPPQSSSNGEEEQIPNRPRGQRPTAPPNPNYNPFQGHTGHAGPHFHHPFGNLGAFGGGGSNFQFAEGFSFFPFFGTGFGFQTSFGFGRPGGPFQNNTPPVNDRDLFDDEALNRNFLSRLLCMLGVIVLLTILFM